MVDRFPSHWRSPTTGSRRPSTTRTRSRRPGSFGTPSDASSTRGSLVIADFPRRLSRIRRGNCDQASPNVVKIINARSGTRSRRFLARSARTVPRMPFMTRPRATIPSPPDRDAGSPDASGRTHPRRPGQPIAAITEAKGAIISGAQDTAQQGRSPNFKTPQTLTQARVTEQKPISGRCTPRDVEQSQIPTPRRDRELI